ncbi:MAG TPA: tetratricopeptide repeat protein [Gemmataceae bacterium]|nr:tetratricopeptide repeat protein [Gemmataceae bacterium]
MIARCLVLVLAAVICTPDLARAQHGPNPPGPILVDASDLYKTHEKQMYEDIEIFRRILDRKLQPLYPTETSFPFGMLGMQGGMMGMQGGMGSMMPGMPGMQGGMGGGMGMAGGMMPVVIPMRSLEGVYLKGQGVVYTATLSSLNPPSKTAKTETLKPVSEWESVRRQVRNEKDELKKVEVTEPPSLSDVMLKLLAENGHHFSWLNPDESLTIVLTVHEPAQRSSPRKSSGGRQGGSAKSASKSSPASSGNADAEEAIRNLELLGELHLKQGKYEEAIAVFQRILGHADSPKRQAEMLRKLAQCHLMQGQDEKARNELDKAILILKKETEAKEKPAASDKPAPALPAKLIISMKRRMLDYIKAGRTSFDDFRREAHVETLRFGER